MIDNFIHCNESALNKKQCQKIINFFEINKQYHDQGTSSGGCDEQVKKCTEMFMAREELEKPFFKDLKSAIKKTQIQYLELYPFLNKIQRWNLAETFKIQKYLQSEAFFKLHCENDGHHNQYDEKRLIAWMVYLNDVADGGETEFPTQKVKFKPKGGNIMFWPAYWTHPHKGIPSLTQIKYIITGWFSYEV